MEHLSVSSAKAVNSLFIPGMLMILVKSLIVTILALSLFFLGASAFFFWLFAGSWLAWLGTFGAGIFAWFLFPAITPVIVNFFDTRIVGIIENRDYPQAEKIQQPPFMKEFLHDLAFTMKALLLNILALPFYLIPIFNLLLFYGLNGYLLGREFFVMVARQHMPIEAAVQLHKRHNKIVGLAGTCLAVAATVPIVNLFAPIWGIALMTHLFHALLGTRVKD